MDGLVLCKSHLGELYYLGLLLLRKCNPILHCHSDIYPFFEENSTFLFSWVLFLV